MHLLAFGMNTFLLFISGVMVLVEGSGLAGGGGCFLLLVDAWAGSNRQLLENIVR